MIVGASSFAGTFPELMEEVQSIELYIPKLGIFNSTKLVRTRIDKIEDFLSSCHVLTSVHAPYFSDAASYPRELVVDTANLSHTGYRLLTDSIEIARDVGSSVVVVHPGRAGKDRQRSFDRMVTSLSRLAGVAEDHGVILGLENKEGTDTGNLCFSADELVQAVNMVGSASLKVTFDIGHANLTCGGDPVLLREYVNEIKELVVHVHVHDNSGRLTEKYWGDFHGAPGTGVVDFSVLSELDFQGVYNLEVFSMDDVRAGKAMLLEVSKAFY